MGRDSSIESESPTSSRANASARSPRIWSGNRTISRWHWHASSNVSYARHVGKGLALPGFRALVADLDCPLLGPSSSQAIGETGSPPPLPTAATSHGFAAMWRPHVGARRSGRSSQDALKSDRFLLSAACPEELGAEQPPRSGALRLAIW
jgi:hypothetical protein